MVHCGNLNQRTKLQLVTGDSEHTVVRMELSPVNEPASGALEPRLAAMVVAEDFPAAGLCVSKSADVYLVSQITTLDPVLMRSQKVLFLRIFDSHDGHLRHFCQLARSDDAVPLGVEVDSLGQVCVQCTDGRYLVYDSAGSYVNCLTLSNVDVIRRVDQVGRLVGCCPTLRADGVSFKLIIGTLEQEA